MEDEEIKIINKKPVRLNNIEKDLTFEVIQFIKKLYEGKDNPLVLQIISCHDLPSGLRIYCIKFSEHLEVEIGENHITLFKNKIPVVNGEEVIKEIKKTYNN